MAKKRATTHARVYAETQDAATLIAGIMGMAVADVYEMAMTGQFGDIIKLAQGTRSEVTRKLQERGLMGDEAEGQSVLVA